MKHLSTAILTAAICLLSSGLPASGAAPVKADATFLFAHRDTCDLFLDVYHPAVGAETSIDGKEKPTILFVFGGGFKDGERDDESYLPWYKMLTDDGFRVVAIDYRLGLKGASKVGLGQASLVEKAIGIAVEDLYSATLFLLENADKTGVDPSNIVIAGSSAGAITVMQGEWELCNRSGRARVLPEGFHYAGVMSFAGAIYSKQGRIRYDREPCPTLMLHGTADKVVNYKQIWFFNLRFAGTDVVTRSFRRGGYNYDTFRFKDRMHEIAEAMCSCYEEEMRFIKENVMEGHKVVIDATVDDPTIPVPEWARNMKGRKELYGSED